MDLRAYYKKVRTIESTLPSPFVVIVSIETADGGKADVFSEVATLVAAKQIAEGRARAATDQETNDFHLRNQEAKLAVDQAAAVNRVEFVVVSAKGTAKGTGKASKE
jgi:hypothetical protein